MTAPRSPTLLPPARRSLLAGSLATLGSVALTTLLIDALKASAPVESLAVAYVPAVLLVASLWGGPLGYATAVLSAAALNWFFLPPTGRFAVADGDNWMALTVFLIVALGAGTLAQRSRARALEAGQRRAEADLATEAARLLLRGGGRLADGLPAVSESLSAALGVRSALTLDHALPDDAQAFALREGDVQIGTLTIDASAPAELGARIERHLVPSLEALLAAALERDALLADVVETAALRRSDVLKTALLRAVSHDLRTPLTAILTAEEALRSSRLAPQEHDELVDDVGSAARRLSRLIDKLLDLGQLEAEGLSARPQSCSLPEVIEAAVHHLGLDDGTFVLTLDRDLPEIVADAAQLERAFGNLLENAARFSGGHPVSVRARQVADRVLLRIVDRGPGMQAAVAERIFEPFYRGDVQPDESPGSGLGLAIVRGFIDANGGRVWAESVPKQGTTFVVEFPVAGPPRASQAPIAARAARP